MLHNTTEDHLVTVHIPVVKDLLTMEHSKIIITALSEWNPVKTAAYIGCCVATMYKCLLIMYYITRKTKPYTHIYVQCF